MRAGEKRLDAGCGNRVAYPRLQLEVSNPPSNACGISSPQPCMAMICHTRVDQDILRAERRLIGIGLATFGLYISMLETELRHCEPCGLQLSEQILTVRIEGSHGREAFGVSPRVLDIARVGTEAHEGEQQLAVCGEPFVSFAQEE